MATEPAPATPKTTSTDAIASILGADVAASILSAGGASVSSGSADNRPVYMGKVGRAVDPIASRRTPNAVELDGGRYTPPPAPAATTVDQALAQFNGWSDAQRRKWSELLQKIGAIAPDDFTWDSAEGWWGKAVDGSAKLQSAGKNVTPQQWASWYSTRAGKGGPGGATDAGRYAPAGTTTSRQKTIPYEDPAALRAMIKDGVHSLLGRKIDDDELDDMMHSARQYESAHPAVSEATTTTDGKGNTSTVNRTVKPGASAEGYQATVEDAVKAKPEYGSFQAAGTFMNWLMGSAGAGGA